MTAIRSYKDFTSNIKGLPEGEYLTQTGWSDTHAWKVVSRSPSGKTLAVVQVLVERDPEWAPDITPGGFVGHCNNQSEQTWLYQGLGTAEYTLRLRKSRYHGSDFLWASPALGNFTANGARHFHDYNF